MRDPAADPPRPPRRPRPSHPSGGCSRWPRWRPSGCTGWSPGRSGCTGTAARTTGRCAGPGRRGAVHPHSTRTRTAFQSATVRLGGTPVAYGPGDLQLNTGESVGDTGRVLGAMLDLLVARTAGPLAELQGAVPGGRAAGGQRDGGRGAPHPGRVRSRRAVPGFRRPERDPAAVRRGRGQQHGHRSRSRPGGGVRRRGHLRHPARLRPARRCAGHGPCEREGHRGPDRGDPRLRDAPARRTSRTPRAGRTTGTSKPDPSWRGGLPPLPRRTVRCWRGGRGRSSCTTCPLTGATRSPEGSGRPPVAGLDAGGDETAQRHGRPGAGHRLSARLNPCSSLAPLKEPRRRRPSPGSTRTTHLTPDDLKPPWGA